jgi:hypothetical protein
MNEKWLWMVAIAIALAGAALTGCGQQEKPQPEHSTVQPAQTVTPDNALTVAVLQPATPPGPSRTVEVTGSLSSPATAWNVNSSQASQENVEKAKADLAKRLGIPTSTIGVTAVIGQEFTPDGFYCQANKGRISKEEPRTLMSGETILLKAQGRRYEYHSDSQAVIFCRPLP